jgi:NAD dependent epimerase/dehydratase
MNLTGKKIFVTGAGGFIGSHLCEALLLAGADVTAMLRYTSRSDWGNLEFLPDSYKKELRVIFGSVEDAEFLYHHMPGHQIVFHLAALIGIPYSYVSPRSYVRTNVEGTLNVLEACRRLDVHRLVHTSTSEVYGTALYTPIDEAHPLQGQSPYSASKIAADKLAESYYKSFQLPMTVVRPFNTFGPRQSARAVIPTIMSQALTRDSICLGSLDPVRDLTFVRDTVEGFLLTATAPGVEGEEINLGVGQGITIGDLARTILEILSLDKPIEQDHQRVRPGKSEVMALISDNGKAARLLNWQPRHSLKEALAQTLEFVRSHPHFFKPDIYAV